MIHWARTSRWKENIMHIAHEKCFPCAESGNARTWEHNNKYNYPDNILNDILGVEKWIVRQLLVYRTNSNTLLSASITLIYLCA